MTLWLYQIVLGDTKKSVHILFHVDIMSVVKNIVCSKKVIKRHAFLIFSQFASWHPYRYYNKISVVYFFSRYFLHRVDIM